MRWNSKDLIPDSEIKNNVTEQSVAFAERFGRHLGHTEASFDEKGRKSSDEKLTSNQLRKFFGEVKRQQMQGFNKTTFVMLKPKLAYAVGRAFANSGNKYFKIKDLYIVLADAIDKVSDEKSFNNFISIFEAIVAYHKAAESGQQLL